MGVLRREVFGGKLFWREMCEISTFDWKFLAGNVDFRGKSFGWKICLCLTFVSVDFGEKTTSRIHGENPLL